MQETNKKVNSCNGECSSCESSSSCSVNNFQLKLKTLYFLITKTKYAHLQTLKIVNVL